MRLPLRTLAIGVVAAVLYLGTATVFTQDVAQPPAPPPPPAGVGQDPGANAVPCGPRARGEGGRGLGRRGEGRGARGQGGPRGGGARAGGARAGGRGEGRRGGGGRRGLNPCAPPAA